MQDFLNGNKRQIFFMLRFSLIVAGLLVAITVVLTTELTVSVIAYAITFIVSMSLFCTLLILLLGYVEYLRENQFFSVFRTG